MRCLAADDLPVKFRYGNAENRRRADKNLVCLPQIRKGVFAFLNRDSVRAAFAEKVIPRRPRINVTVGRVRNQNTVFQD